MNKFVICFALSVASAIAAPSTSLEVEAVRKLPALQHEEIHDELGQYSLRYVTAEGTIVAESGRLIPNPDGEGTVMIVEGEVTYIGDDGIAYTSKYRAGVNGYEVEAAHLPVAPPLPPVPVVPTVSVVEFVPPVPIVEVVPPVPTMPVVEVLPMVV